MTAAELFDLLLEGLESGRMQGDEPVSTEMLDGRHEDPVEYLARKYGKGVMRMDKKSLEEYRSKKDEIAELDWTLRNRWQDEGLFGNNVIMDYRKGYPRPRNVIGFDYARYDRLQERDRARKAILLTECEEVEEWIEEIPDSLTRRIFKMTYIEGRKQKAVAKAVHLDQSRVSRKIDEYLKQEEE